ncbi:MULTISPECIES: hypothetical protein [Pseudomonas]|uniref:hypothetical protein n=1 Tax=Pseudomonas TaxID=286 RepID=UPI0012D41654|nr:MULTISPECIES: hypothetical protein [Pseudomonas]QXE10664.1 hypothetical protein GTQ41_16875 [Pseudomonas sp. AN-B15]
MSQSGGKIKINLAPEWELELEIQAEAAGMLKEDYLIELLEAYCKSLDQEENPPSPLIH